MLGRTHTLEVLVEDIGQPQHCKVVEEDGVGVGDRVHESGYQRADVEDTQHGQVEREYTWVSACGSDIKCDSILSAHVWVMDVQPGSYAASHLVYTAHTASDGSWAEPEWTCSLIPRFPSSLPVQDLGMRPVYTMYVCIVLCV